MAQRFKRKSTETFNQESRAEFIRSLKPGDKVFVCMRNGDLVTTGEVSTYSTTQGIWIHRNGQLVSFSRKTGKERGRDLFLEVYDAGEYEEYCEKANREIATWCEEEERKQREQVKATMREQRYTDYTIPQRYQVSCRGYQDDSVLAHDAEQEGKLVSITEAEYQAQVEADAADYWQQRSQLESTDMVTLPGTIVTMRATEAAAELAQICHGLRAGLTIAERVYAPKGLGNLANEWLLARWS